MSTADSPSHSPFAKSRRVGVWLVLILLGLAVLAVGASVYQGWSLLQQQRKEAITRTGGDPDKGPALLTKYGCVNCHNIPGMNAPNGSVGPDLSGFGHRAFIAGVLANTPDNLMRWIVEPRAIDPKTAMPKTGITPDEARDVATYLYAQP